MNVDSVVYTTRSVNLGDHILLQQCGEGDYEAMLELILARTDLQEDQALSLEDEEAAEIMRKIGEGIAQSYALKNLAKEMDDG